MSPTPGGKDRTYQEIVRLLAPTLGQTKSEEIVQSVAAGLGQRPETIDINVGMIVLDALSRQAGIIGVAARLAILRLEQQRRLARGGDAAPERASPKLDGPSPVISLRTVKALLAPTLGMEKADEVVNQAAALFCFGDELDQGEAHRLFDYLAQAGGIISTAAHFAKARLILRRKG